MATERVGRALVRWLVLQRIGKRKATQHYYWELVKAIRSAWRFALDKRVDEITEEDVTKFALVARHYSPSRWNGLLQVLHATVPASRMLKRRPVRPAYRVPPSGNEYAALLEAAERVNCRGSHLVLVIKFLSHTGMRIGEARRLKWESVHSDRIEVPAPITKPGRPKVIPFVNGAADVLEALRGVGKGSDYVLPRKNFRKALATACAKAGLRNLTPHDFRRMFATRCVESGVDIPTVAGWLGHKDRGVTLSRYVYVLEEHSRRMAARVQITPQRIPGQSTSVQATQLPLLP